MAPNSISMYFYKSELFYYGLLFGTKKHTKASGLSLRLVLFYALYYCKNEGEVCWTVHPQTGSMS